MEPNPAYSAMDVHYYNLNFQDPFGMHHGCTFDNEGEGFGRRYSSNPTQNPVLPLMQRYLTEPDTHLFMPSIMETDFNTMDTLPEVPFYAPHITSPYEPNGWSQPDCFTSPTYSNGESSYVSSEWSDRQLSPLSSPHLEAARRSPYHDSADEVTYAYASHVPAERHDSHSPEACVALHDVQKCADELPEAFPFSNDPITSSVYGSYAQEGYQPIQPGDETSSGEMYSTPGADSRIEEEGTSRDEPESPVIRRRRPQARRPSTISAQLSSGRIHKRTSSGGRRTAYLPEEEDSSDARLSNRAFPCPLAVYGCTSTFGSKNEWKRHVSTQHMRLGYWRCDQCVCSNGERKPNDFNRKDLFIQHVRRMHPHDAQSAGTNSKRPNPRKSNNEEQSLRKAAERCYRHLRPAPEKSQCLYCEQHFQGTGSWEERMEHIGRHMENAKKEHESARDPCDWLVDEGAEEWFTKQQVIVVEAGRLVLST